MRYLKPRSPTAGPNALRFCRRPDHVRAISTSIPSWALIVHKRRPYVRWRRSSGNAASTRDPRGIAHLASSHQRGPRRMAERLACRDMDALPMSEETGAHHALRPVDWKDARLRHDGHKRAAGGRALSADTRNFKKLSRRVIFSLRRRRRLGRNVMVPLRASWTGLRSRGLTHCNNATDIEVAGSRHVRGPMMAGVSEFLNHREGVWLHMPLAPTDCVRSQVGRRDAHPHRHQHDCVAQWGAFDQLGSLTIFEAGRTNIIPETAVMRATVQQNFQVAAARLRKRRSPRICCGTGTAMGLRSRWTSPANYPPTINDAPKDLQSPWIGRELSSGQGSSDDNKHGEWGPRNFSYIAWNVLRHVVFYLNVAPRAWAVSAHHPKLTFNDEMCAHRGPTLSSGHCCRAGAALGLRVTATRPGRAEMLGLCRSGRPLISAAPGAGAMDSMTRVSPLCLAMAADAISAPAAQPEAQVHPTLNKPRPTTLSSTAKASQTRCPVSGRRVGHG